MIQSLNGQLSLDRLNKNQRTYYYLPNSAFWDGLSMESQPLSMESQPQNPELRNNPENFHPWMNIHNMFLMSEEIKVQVFLCQDDHHRFR